MTDMDRVDELPAEYRAAAKNNLVGVDRLRLAGKNIQEEQAEGEADQKAVPDNAVRIESRGEAPDGAKVIEGDRGGLYYIPEGEEAAGEDEGEEAGEPEEVSADEIGEGDVGKNVQVTADGHTTEGELVGVEDVPGRDETGQQLVIQGDSFVPSRIRVSSISEASLAGGAEGGEGDGFNTGDATADELLELFDGSDVPEDLNPANGGNVRSLSDLGIAGGVNNSQMRVVRLNDGSEGFMTSYRKATRTGPGDPDPEAAQNAALADSLIEQMGGNAVESAAADHGYVSKEVQGNMIENVNPVVLDEDSLRETMAAGAVLGNIDMHKQNLMQNADGEVVSVDNDMAGQASLRNEDPVEFELSQTYQVFNAYHRNRTEQGELETTEEDMRDFADSITEAANNIDLDELPDDEDNDQLQRMRDNIEFVQENPDWYEESGTAADVEEVIL